MKSKMVIYSFFLTLLLGLMLVPCSHGAITEFRVNTYTTDNQQSPSVAMGANGNFLIAWHSLGQDGSGWGIYAQRYDSAGNPIGSEFRVNTYTANDQANPSVAMDADGNFVIAWVGNLQDGSEWGIYAQRYGSAGNPLGSEFRVNTYTTDNQLSPSVAMGANGNFLIAWHSRGQDGSGWGIYAQRYDSAGNPVGSEFRVNTYTTDNQLFPSVAMDPNGNFLIAWQSLGQDGSGWGIYAQRYGSAGNPVGSEFRVNTYTANDQGNPSVAMDADGNFVIAWRSDGQDGSEYGIYAQRYSSAGNPLGSEFQVNTYTANDQWNPSVTMDADGNFVIAWDSNGQDGSGWGIYAQRYDSAGNPIGSEFRVNTYTANDQGDPSVAMDADGNFLIAWQSNGQDGSEYGIYAHLHRLEVGPSGYPYTSIQAAINDALPGDTVLVHDGTYVENITFSGKAITVKSVNGAARTIINPNGSGRGVTFNHNEGSGSVLDGFTITNGYVLPGVGGGIQCWYASPTITNCIIIGNYASYNGGGISCYGEASPTITNCTISGNTSGDGWGGGISCGYSSHPTITNCTISGNHGWRGAAISCDTSCSPTITNCTISGNVGNVTGGIYIYASSSPSVKNTILWGNAPNEIYFVDPGVSSITLTYSNVDQDGYAGSNGNIRQNPLFVDPANGNFRLQPTSPCIDAATSDGAPLTDMVGNSRYDAPSVPNTGGGTYPYYDMGALELTVSKPIIDFDGDGSSDLAGINSNGHIFYTTNLSTWTNIPGVLTQLVVGDFNGDGQSDLAGINSNGHVFYTTDLSTWTNIPGVLTQLVVGDFDGDSQSDLAGINSNGHVFYTTDLSTWTNIPGVLVELAE